MKIDRVIVSSDENEIYLPFWPLIAKAWKDMGIQPTLALIAHKGAKVDTSIGDVIYFEPIQGIPTSFFAQVIRLLLPIYFENDICLLSDIDMLPLNKAYFVDSIKKYSDDCFVTFRDQASDFYIKNNMFPMCYNVAKGSVFQEVFKISDPQTIPRRIKYWYRARHGWYTDEIMLGKYLNSWEAKQFRLIKLGHKVKRRIDRGRWEYNETLLKEGYYIDSHLLRPYSQYRSEIDHLAHLMGFIEK